MRTHHANFQIFFRIDDQRFVIHDILGFELFEGTYREIEDWLDQYDNCPNSTAAEDIMLLRSLGPLEQHRRR